MKRVELPAVALIASAAAGATACSWRRVTACTRFTSTRRASVAAERLLRRHSGASLLLRCHLPMRCRRGLAGEGFRIAQIDQSPDQFESVVEFHAHLVAAAASKRSAPEQHLSASRSRHPSAVALANSRPPETAPGWYPDPTDDERRRIRFWDGAGWTAHVAEPQG